MKKLTAIITLTSAVILAAACTDKGSGPLGGESGQINVLMTDAPFPFADVKSVDVFVVRIDGKTAESDLTESENESEMGGWTTLVSPNASINLLSLTNGKTANLGQATLPAGTYRGFRLIIDPDKSSVTLTDGSKAVVKWPGSGKNGIKINLDEPVVIGPTSPNLLLDFDVGRSFVMRGNLISKNGLLFKPVIRATTQQSTGTVSGSVHGESATGPVVAGATVELLNDGSKVDDDDNNKVVRSGMTDAGGNYTIAFVRPGTYVLRATPPSGSVYKPGVLAGVAIAVGSATTGKIIVVPK